MTSSAPTSLLTLTVGFLAGALATVLAMLAIVLVDRQAPATSDELAGGFDVEVVYVDDGVCGATMAGCFLPRTPDRVYLEVGLGELERDVLLHELAHAIQHRAGMPLDECAADRIAIELGASAGLYDC